MHTVFCAAMQKRYSDGIKNRKGNGFMQKNGDVIEINAVDFFLFMLRGWYVFLAAMLLTTAAGMAICLLVITPKYESTTKIIILSQQDSGALTYSDMQLASQLTKDYEELIVSRDVLESVIRECSLEDDYDGLSKRVEVENITDTRIISIAVEDPSPEEAQRIVNSIRETAAAHIRNVTDVEAVNVAEEANLPVEPSSPSKFIWAVLSMAAGFLIAFIIQTVRLLSDDTIKSSEDVVKYLGLSTLAMVPKADMDAQGSPIPRKKGSQKKYACARNAGNRKRSRGGDRDAGDKRKQ